MRNHLLWIMSCVFSCIIATANAQVPPIEAYGQLPSVKSMDLAPDGSAIVYLLNKDGTEAMSVFDFQKGPVAAVGTGGLKTRYVEYINDQHVIIHAAEFTRVKGYLYKRERNAAFSVNLDKQKPVMLAKYTKGIHPVANPGRIVGLSSTKNKVFMPVLMEHEGKDPSYDLLSVDLGNGQGRTHEKGIKNTRDWIVNEEGTVLAREDFDNKANYYAVRTKRNGKWELVYEENDAELYPFSIVGTKADESALIIQARSSRLNFVALYELGFDGKISTPIFARTDASVDWPIVDDNRVLYGVQYAGMYPSYDFYDDSMDSSMETIQATFPASAVHLEGWTNDWSKLLVRIEAGGIAGEYYTFDRANNKLSKVADKYAGIPRGSVADVVDISYKARDGLKIPSVLTWPLGDEERKNLPLIVMPHGGPESYDAVGFDWMAQYFASRGYAVLQPNFRGSDGFGTDFRNAGRGEWGLKMQDDVSDGVNALVKAGIADPARVCIVGASYGGYSALAGGAFSPELYKCVVAIAPVSDLPLMLADTEFDYGEDHWVVSYWKRVIGDSKEAREKLNAVSPAKHAENFQAPVLLIHGKDDWVVPMDQSTVMERALKRANKDVTFVKLKGEDHYLSVGESRLETLKLMSDFVQQHNPAN